MLHSFQKINVFLFQITAIKVFYNSIWFFPFSFECKRMAKEWTFFLLLERRMMFSLMSVKDGSLNVSEKEICVGSLKILSHMLQQKQVGLLTPFPWNPQRNHSEIQRKHLSRKKVYILVTIGNSFNYSCSVNKLVIHSK